MTTRSEETRQGVLEKLVGNKIFRCPCVYVVFGAVAYLTVKFLFF